MSLTSQHIITQLFPTKLIRLNKATLRWSHDQKIRRPTTKSSIQSQTQWKEKSRKTEIQVGGWAEQR
jgi:hypothetical protein